MTDADQASTPESDLFGRCGTDCSKCDYRETNGCPGCVRAAGEMFWGKCDVAACCIERSHVHCGHCVEFPCEMLKAFAYDSTQGDEGKRIRTARKWKEEDVR